MLFIKRSATTAHARALRNLKSFEGINPLISQRRSTDKEEGKQAKKFFIVDDNDDVSKGLRIYFRTHDYATVIASVAVAAISQAKKENPDLIVLDLGLPAGDGYLVMERLSNVESLASIPVIVFTARDEETHKERSLKAEAKAFFQKPVDHAVHLSVIQEILEGPSGMQVVDI